MYRIQILIPNYFASQIFSTAELRPLHQLRILDLSGNKIKALEEGIFKGCENLQVSCNFNCALECGAKNKETVGKNAHIFV